jgi:tetratricopeptide (TPR) repeat protein
MIAKNEEANLPSCLASVVGLVDEAIIVDTGSTDRTKEVAASLGARVFDFAWVDSFAAARNESLRHATGDWILWLDGDERFDDENRAKLKALLAGLGTENAAYVMKQRSSPEAATGSPTVVDQVRLFRNLPSIRWEYRVHEQILMAVRRAGHEVRFTDICIEHAGYEDPALRRRKTERNLRLLHREVQERPNDPFTLFNLGWSYFEVGDTAQAIAPLQRSLELSQPGDSIVRKLYSLLAQSHNRLGQDREALAACRTGLARYPDDVELLFLEAQLLQDRGDLAGAEACLRQLLHTPPGKHFASLDAGLRGPKTRYQLAHLYRDQGRTAEAEEQWRAAVAEHPACSPAWQGLGELYLVQGRWAELEEAVSCLKRDPPWAVEAGVLRARGHLARKEYGAARRILEEILARVPQAVGPRVYLSHVLLEEGRDLGAAERVLRAVVERDLTQAEAWRNLTVLLDQQQRWAEALEVCQQGLRHRPEDRELQYQLGLLLWRQGDRAGAEGAWLRFLAHLPRAGPAGDRYRNLRNAARHNLASMFFDQRRFVEAEAQWRAVLAEQPDFLDAWLGLADLCLAQRRFADVAEVAQQIRDGLQAVMQAHVLLARAKLANQEFAEARAILQQTIADHPQALWPRVILSHVLLQEGKDWTSAEKSLRDILDLDPGHREAQRNLAVLLQKQGKRAERGEQTTPLLVECPPASRPTPSEGQTLLPPPSELPARKDLRIGFGSFSPFAFTPDTPHEKPLGGSESALCYLGEALARQGHEVYLLNSCPEPASVRGVRCLPLQPETLRSLPPLDAFVVQNCAGRNELLRSHLGDQTRLILWTQHAHDQPALQALHDARERDAYDAVVCVSDWQRREYLRHFGLDEQRVVVMRNAVGPTFENLFAEHESLLEAKFRPPVLAYTSTPFRGLDLLLEAYPRIREAVPGVILKVFSSMQVYGVPEGEDRDRYGWLYQKCRELDGVHYVGSLPQPQLAQELRGVAVLAYPNTFAETSCIAVLEAMASGCQIVTTALGALPETTAGFARLVPGDGNRESYLRCFVEATVAVLTRLATASPAEAEDDLRRQVAYINQTCTWSVGAKQWAQWLSATSHSYYGNMSPISWGNPPSTRFPTILM